VIRPRGGTTRRRDDEIQITNSSAEEIGRLLRNAREERGLDLLAVHDRLSRPITMLEALETGNLSALPDQAQALVTLRRYAAFLGLDGDALALQMIDAWSALPSGNGAPANPAGAVTNVVTAVTTGPDHLRAFTQTGEVPKVGAGSSAGAGGSGAYGYGVASGPPTGTFPVVPRNDIRESKRAVAKARRRLRASTSLKVVTWSTGVLVVVLLVGFGIQRWQPQWLVRSHILRIAGPGSTTASGGNPGTGSVHLESAVMVTSTSTQSSSYTVAASHFAVNLATSGKCWVQVTSSGSPTPLVVGVQPPGKQLSFPASGTMTVEVGASAVVIGISVQGKPVFFNSPHETPYTYTFVAAPGS
jgi:hypothetical protein